MAWVAREEFCIDEGLEPLEDLRSVDTDQASSFGPRPHIQSLGLKQRETIRVINQDITQGHVLRVMIKNGKLDEDLTEKVMTMIYRSEIQHSIGGVILTQSVIGADAFLLNELGYRTFDPRDPEDKFATPRRPKEYFNTKYFTRHEGMPEPSADDMTDVLFDIPLVQDIVFNSSDVDHMMTFFNSSIWFVWEAELLDFVMRGDVTLTYGVHITWFLTGMREPNNMKATKHGASFVANRIVILGGHAPTCRIDVAENTKILLIVISGESSPDITSTLPGAVIKTKAIGSSMKIYFCATAEGPLSFHTSESLPEEVDLFFIPSSSCFTLYSISVTPTTLRFSGGCIS